MEHISVLRDDVQKQLMLSEGATVVDGTLGLGGHSKDILNQIGSNGRLFAFDQDSRNLDEAAKRLAAFKEQIVFINDNFRYLKTRLTGSGVDLEGVDAILLDLGLSSPHVDEAQRGFSFSKDGPLDMRFDPRNPLTAADIVNTYSQDDLQSIFSKYGEERQSKKIARLICERRTEQKFESTTELANLIEANTKFGKKKKSSHPATQVFQALRIAVNDEMKVLEEVLEQSMEMLKVGGRLVVISYHSVEDRVVKQFFKSMLQPPGDGVYSNHGDPFIESLTRKPVLPSEKEIEENPRSRSAKLRAIKKIKPYP